MDLESTRTLRGPNKWSNTTVIEGVVKLAGVAAQDASGRVIGVAEYLSASSRSAVLKAIGIAQSDSRSAVSVVAELTLAIEQTLGCQVGFRQVVDTTTHDTFRVIVEYDEEQVGRDAMNLAVDVVAGRASVEVFPGALQTLNSLYQGVRLGPSHRMRGCGQ